MHGQKRCSKPRNGFDAFLLVTFAATWKHICYDYIFLVAALLAVPASLLEAAAAHVERHLRRELDTVTASMAKYWLTDLQNKIVDRCLQLFGGYGYMDEYPISRMYRDARVQRIYAGTNEIMKLLIARSL